MKFIVFTLISILPSCLLSGPMNFLCKTDEMVGFVYRDGDWKPYIWADPDARYLVSVKNGTVTKFGEEEAFLKNCEGDNVFTFACPESNSFEFYKFGERFIRRFHNVRILLPGDENTVSPIIELGTCEPFY